MRYLALGVAAFLAIIMVAPASAFEFDSTGGATPGVGSNYADPFDGIDSQLQGSKKTDETETPNNAKVLNGLQFSVSGSRSSSSVSGTAMGWTNPQPGRLTH